jgi:hypothetical protein
MFPALAAAPVPVQWAAKNAAHRAGVALCLLETQSVHPSDVSSAI